MGAFTGSARPRSATCGTCASNTREGEVYRRLLDKLEEARAALGGKVYDVLGELFEGQALRDLLVNAIRYGDRPDVKAELLRKVDGAVDVGTIETLVAERTSAKKARNFSRADEIRAQLAAQGVVLEDTKEGVRWKRS